MRRYSADDKRELLKVLFVALEEMNQNELADRVGVPKSAITDWKQDGKIGPKNLEKFDMFFREHGYTDKAAQRVVDEDMEQLIEHLESLLKTLRSGASPDFKRTTIENAISTFNAMLRNGFGGNQKQD